MQKCVECEDAEAKFSDPRESCDGDNTLCKDCAEAAYIDLIYEAESEIRDLRRQAAKLGLNLS